MYTTRVHILYARAMIERPLGKRARLSLRNREAKLFSRLLHKLRFRRKGFRYRESMFLVDQHDSCIEEEAYPCETGDKAGDKLSRSSVTAVKASLPM